jgi:hypothetical protein
MEFSAMPVVLGSIFQTVQCTKVPLGASGSSTINTKLWAVAGISLKESGGFTPLHHKYIWKEYFRYFQRSELVIFMRQLYSVEKF